MGIRIVANMTNTKPFICNQKIEYSIRVILERRKELIFHVIKRNEEKKRARILFDDSHVF
jgi:hypothetical protein